MEVLRAANTEFLGEGRNHPAQLDLDDRFAYAMARVGRIPLLFRGGDFAKADSHSAA